jgi:hypothetical protein
MGKRSTRVGAVLKLLASVAYVTFIGAALSLFVADTVDALVQKDAVRFCKNIVLYLAGLATSAMLEVLADD